MAKNRTMQDCWDAFCRIAGTDEPHITGSDLSRILAERKLTYGEVTDAVLEEIHSGKVRPSPAQAWAGQRGR